MQPSETKPEYTHCGGCGASSPEQRCIGCLHNFGGGSWNPSVDLPQSPWPASDWAIERIAELEAGLKKIAAADPVAEIVKASTPAAEILFGRDIKFLADQRDLPIGTKLYAHPPTPVSSPRDERDGAIYAKVSKRQFSDDENAAIDRDIANRLSALSDRSGSGDAVRVKIKLLEWNPFRAETAFGYYHIDDQTDRTAEELNGRLPFLLSGSRVALSRHSTLAGAKAAAQADYEAKIRSALITSDRTEEGRDETNV